MSQLSDSIKNPMRDKAKRLTSGEPHTKVDSSTWTPPEMENAGVKTGLRPLSKRQYKSGGKVHGAMAKKRADRMARKSGGRTEAEDRSKRYLTPDNLLNRDVRMANEQREGTKHVGGFKKGGKIKRSHHMDGQTPPMNSAVPAMTPEQLALAKRGIDPFGGDRFTAPRVVPNAPMARRPMPNPVPLPPARPAMLKKGGAAKHTDEVQDKKLMHKILKPKAFKADGGAMHHKDCSCKMCMGGAAKSKKADGGKVKWIQGAIKHPGSLHKALHVPEGEKIPAKKLEKAAHSDNPKLAKKANLAKTLKRMHHAKGGSVFEGDSMTKIPGAVGGRKAHAKGGKAKGKTNININVMPHHPSDMGPMGGAMTPPPRPPMPPMAPPAGGPPMGAPPMGAPPMGGPMGAPPMGGMPPMMRNAGGRTGKDVGGAMSNPLGSAMDPTIAAAMRNQMMPNIAGGGMSPQQIQALANARTNPQANLSGIGSLVGAPMMRNTGGRAMAKTEHVIDHAAGGGLGRLEKIKAYGEPQKRMK